MRRIWSIIFSAFLLALLCGCAGPEDANPQWDESWARVGELLAVEPMEGFQLQESNDVLGMSGIYYFTWSCGEGRSFTNAEGEEATVFDGQIYLLLSRCKSPEEAEKTLEDWIALEKQPYETGAVKTEAIGEQSFQLLPLLSGSADNPYTHGAAAFAARGDFALSVELLCSEGFEGDPQSILKQFLSGIHYGE